MSKRNRFTTKIYNRSILFLFSLVVSLTTLNFFAPLSYACTIGGYPPSIAKRTDAATFIVEGTPMSKVSETTAVFTVHRWLKGNGPSTITVTGFGYSTACRSEIDLNKRVILFAVGNPNTELHLNQLWAWDAVVPSDRTTAAKINIFTAAESTLPHMLWNSVVTVSEFIVEARITATVIVRRNTFEISVATLILFVIGFYGLRWWNRRNETRQFLDSNLG